MAKVRAKKHLGQHFLRNEKVAKQIVDALILPEDEQTPCLEIGPGTGVLTQFLIERNDLDLQVIEIDNESVDFLLLNFEQLRDRILQYDFLKLKLDEQFDSPFVIIGNFPYNISNQILFKVFENKMMVPQVVGMFQKEVAKRIASPPGSKVYGILSVLLQAYYDIEYLFTVDENEFIPPPKVKSGVIRLVRNQVNKLDCNEKLFFQLVKTSFNQRRKTIRNSIKSIIQTQQTDFELLSKRPEQLSVEQFVALTNWVEANRLS